MDNQKSYYAIIPATIRYDKDLTANAKLLYGEISALCNEKGHCWAKNSYFAELYGVDKKTISNWISMLAKKGYINVILEYRSDSKEIANRFIEIVDTPYPSKNGYPINKKMDTPIHQNVKDNNTYINNTNEYINNNKSNMNLIIDFYNNNIGQLTQRGLEYLEAYTDDFDEDVIIYAMELAVKNNARTISYITAILDNWHKSDLHNLVDIKNKKKQKEEPKTESRNYSEDFFNSLYAN